MTWGHGDMGKVIGDMGTWGHGEGQSGADGDQGFILPGYLR